MISAAKNGASSGGSETFEPVGTLEARKKWEFSASGTESYTTSSHRKQYLSFAFCKGVWIWSFPMATALAVASGFHDYAISKAFSEKTSLTYWLIGELFLFWFWAAITPAILAMMQWIPVRKGNWTKSTSVHLTVYAILAAVYTAYYLLIDAWIGPNNEAGLQRDFLHTLWVALTGGIVKYYLPILVAGYIVTYYTRARESAARNAQLIAQLSEVQLRTLRAQLQPHFLFNTLHSIATLVYTDPRRADEMISHLSDLLRMSLEAGDRECVALSEELEYVRKYLAIEQTRFSDRLSIRYSIDPNSVNFSVPHFILQPIVENAIRHGVSKKTGKGAVSLTTVVHNDCLRIMVDDDGPGIQCDAVCNSRGGFGLRNTRKRLEQFYGPNFRLEIFSPGIGAGTRAEILLAGKNITEETDAKDGNARELRGTS